MMTDARDAHPELTVVRLCEAFSLSRSSFYEYKNNEDTDPDDELATEIETIIEEFVGYGLSTGHLQVEAVLDVKFLNV